jgi:mono/diheme cytochrome c family protein
LTPDSLERLSHTEILDILLNGRPGTAMPPFKAMLSQEEIEALARLIKDTSPSPGGDEKSAPVITTPSPAEETEEKGEARAAVPVGNARMGRDIFVGKTPLQNGGAACLSCHNINGIGALGGGTVGKDLTEAYATFGEQGLTSILRTTPFPMMTEIYAEKPLTDDETAHLLAFLGESRDTKQLTSGQSPFIFILIGIIGLLLIVIILQTIWRGRLSGVRQSLVKGGSK